MDRDALIEALIEAAREATTAEEFEAAVPELWRTQAQDIWGSWQSALMAALVSATDARVPKKARQSGGVAQVERQRNEAFEYPIYIATTDDKFYALEGPRLGVSDDVPPTGEPGLHEDICATHFVGDSEGVFLFTNEGRFFGLNSQLVPGWNRRDDRRSVRDLLFLSPGEAIRAIVPRRRLVAGRFVHITRQGKGKASDVSELGRGLDRSGRQAFKVRDGDDVVAVLGVERDTTIFCASAMGKGIHFESDELRTMGLVAVGVNTIKLADDEDAVVGAFEGKRVRQVAVITEQGLGKRVDFSEFRTQGRAGQGMQLARLNPGDRLAAAVACNPAEDLAITTSTGKVWRVPTAQVHLMGRPAKGNPVIELPPGERIIDMTAIPCGG